MKLFRTSNTYKNSSNASAFCAIFNRFACDFKASPPYSAAASHFVMKPPPATSCGQVDLQVARQSYLCQISHIQVMRRRRVLMRTPVAPVYCRVYVWCLPTVDLLIMTRVCCSYCLVVSQQGINLNRVWANFSFIFKALICSESLATGERTATTK
jgi:hypothetical protein